MRNKLLFIGVALFFLCTGFNYSALHAKAYIDLSDYKVKTGKFEDNANANNSLKVFMNKTGWKGTVQKSGAYQNYYQVVSSGFSGEDRAKAILQDFKITTGLNASYEGIGQPQKYYWVQTKDSFDMKQTNGILQDFKKSTGINAVSTGAGKPENYYKIISGNYSNEAQVKTILQDFQKSTGISAGYQGVGNQEKYYVVVSGNITGLSQVQKAAKDFIAATGIQAAYISSGKNTYRIQTEPILSTAKIKKASDYLRQKKLSVTQSATGKSGYEKYQITTTPLLGAASVNKAQTYFVQHKQPVTKQATGKTGYERYQIQSESLMDTVKIKKAQGYFQKNHYIFATVYTGKSIYQTYRISAASVLGTERVKKAQTFFHNRGLTSTRTAAGKTAPIYEIVTNEFEGYDKTQAAIQKIKSLFGWTAAAVKTKNGPQLMYTNYGLSLNSMVIQEMAQNPQTDKYRDVTRYVYASYVNISKQIITADDVNVRSAASTKSTIVQKLNKGDGVIVLGKTGNWVKVKITWQKASASDVNYYLKASNFSIGSKSYFQFLKLSQPANLDVKEVNAKILNGKGILAGKGQAFIDAGKKYQVNEIYLISHSLLETGNGTSKLATGVTYKGKKVYNMYGYGAFDSCPITCGAQTAYENQWFTPEAAIFGGAKLISSGYIQNSIFQQDTLYKMRWNPIQTWHQYATDAGWAYKQVTMIYNMYHLLDHYTLYYDVPIYQ